MTPSVTSPDMSMTHSDPAMQKEHDQLKALVPVGAATHVAKQSGAWFDPNTWQGGKVPGENAKVLISKGVTVDYDSLSDARIYTIDVDGDLAFAADKDTKLVVDTFVVSSEGKLEIGTENNPVQANVKTEILIADNGPLDRNWDPAQLSRGLISHGDVQMYGQAKTSHLKVAADPMAGDRTLALASAPKNWQVGDRLVLTGTQHTPELTNGQKWEAATQDEEVVIQSIKGNSVTLDRALKFDHTTPRSDLKAYVANQTRNIVIASENGESTPIAERGHTMFMHSDDIDIRYVEFDNLGRTDKSKPLDNFQDTGGTYPKRILDAKGNPKPGAMNNVTGRYSAHIHRAGVDGKPAVLVGNAIDGSPGWGFTVHDSNAILEDNVAYDVDGGAFVTESGNEMGAMRNNIAIKTGPGVSDYYDEKQGTGTHDFARSGVGFWFQGRAMENEGNVAAGSRNAGMFYFHRGVDQALVEIDDLPVPGLAKFVRDKTSGVDVDQVPIQNFKNNEVFASGQGLHVVKDFPKQTNDLRTVMNGFKGWEVERGAEFQYTSHYTLNDFDLISSENPTAWRNQGLELQKNTQDFVFNNMTVDGFTDGIAVGPDTGEGPAALADKGFFWIDLTLKNNTTDLKGLEIPPEEWLKSSALKPGTLDFKVSGDADFFVDGDEASDYIDIRGTKTDSLGSIEMPFGDESLAYGYQGVVEMIKRNGYYTLGDGTRATVIEEYIADRVTGEVKSYPFVVTFDEDWWTDGAEFKGELDPNSIGEPTKVTLPASKFSLSRGPITSVPPVTAPTPPEAPDPDSVVPVPTDPVVPDPVVLEPTDSTDPDPVTPDPIVPDPVVPPVDFASPDPVAPGPVVPPITPAAPQFSQLDPVVSYDFEEAISGIAKDNSAGGNNSGETWYGVARSEGLNGSKGLTMDGTGSIRLKNSADINLGVHQQRSLSLWFKADQLSADTGKQVLYEEGGSDIGLNAYLDKDKLYVGGWDQSGGAVDWEGTWLSTAEGVSAGDWHHVAVVLDGADALQPDALTAYLDGEEIGSGEGAKLMEHSDRIAFGSAVGSTRFHDGVSSGRQGLVGSLDEAKIFNQSLTGEQVEALAAV